jgi:hypothetical protein
MYFTEYKVTDSVIDNLATLQNKLLICHIGLHLIAYAVYWEFVVVVVTATQTFRNNVVYGDVLNIQGLSTQIAYTICSGHYFE